MEPSLQSVVRSGVNGSYLLLPIFPSILAGLPPTRRLATHVKVHSCALIFRVHRENLPPEFYRLFFPPHLGPCHRQVIFSLQKRREIFQGAEIISLCHLIVPPDQMRRPHVERIAIVPRVQHGSQDWLFAIERYFCS